MIILFGWVGKVTQNLIMDFVPLSHLGKLLPGVFDLKAEVDTARKICN
jgi:hypothetical protein